MLWLYPFAMVCLLGPSQLAMSTADGVRPLSFKLLPMSDREYVFLLAHQTTR